MKKRYTHGLKQQTRHYWKKHICPEETSKCEEKGISVLILKKFLEKYPKEFLEEILKDFIEEFARFLKEI